MIRGSYTDLDNSQGVFISAKGSSKGETYVANAGNYEGGSPAVLVFAAGASGNTPPIVIIAGNNTELDTPVGIDVDRDGNMYAADVDSNSVEVFAAGSNGNVAPIQRISGTYTGLEGPYDAVVY